MAVTDSLVMQFIAETRDNLDDAARGLLALEGSSGNRELVNGIFRSIHTIKGTSGIFPEFQAITTLTHAAEELMDQVRNDRIRLESAHVDLFLSALDLVGNWLEDVESRGALPEGAAEGAAPLRERFRRFLHPEDEQTSPPETGSCGETSPDAALLRNRLCSLPPERRKLLLEGLEAGGTFHALLLIPDENCFFFGDDPVNLFRQLEQILLLEVGTPPPPESPESYDPFVCGLTFLAVVGDERERIEEIFGYVSDRIVLARLEPSLFEPEPHVEDPAGAGLLLALELPDEMSRAVAPAAPGEPAPKKPASSGTLRIDQDVVNRFVDLVGEMIIAKNSLPYLSIRAEEHYRVPELAEEIDARCATISQIVGSLQEIAFEMRMMPVAKAFERFPRLVRDISSRLGKKIILTMEGEETRADKDVIEALSEPLVHMVRNSLDHGIETPEERIAAGKPAEGHILLKAFQDESGIVVEIVDDGRGIDPDRIRRKAAERGIASAENLAAMADDEVIQLIMAPNFSTADAISDLSGRGVGMDVVNSMVNGFGGSVRVFSRKGEGSRIRLSLPLSMAITRILIVRQGEGSYGISSTEVVETMIDVPLDRVSTVRGAPGLEVRGQLLPLYHLARQLGLEGAPLVPEGRFSAVIVRVRGENVAIAVDSFCDIIDAVVKPLSGIMADAACFAGSTILGDGTITFMLNLPEVITHAG